MQSRSFDVICAGAASWTLSPALRMEPGGGAAGVAAALATKELRVALATSLPDDTAGRALLARVRKQGVETSGVVLVPPRTGLLLLEGDAIVEARADEGLSLAIPAGWAAPVLFLSGLSPLVSQAGATCKAARAARRAGSIVVLDVDARWHLWAGRDARTVRMVLREADVVCATANDLVALAMDGAALGRELRRDAVLLLAPSPMRSDAFVARVCADVARKRVRPDVWQRALDAAR